MSEEKVGPVDHISRSALPWRAAELTECGKSVAELGGRVVSRDEIRTRIQRIGQKRAAFSTCMTCAETSDRWSRFGRDDAVLAVSREARAVEHASAPIPGLDDGDDVGAARRRSARDLWRRRQLLSAELEALGALVEAHREEFDGYIAGLGETVSLSDRRTAQRFRRQRSGGAS
jgi:hypothetical protein